MKVNLLLIISKISKVVFFEWIADTLNRDSFEVTFAVMNDQPTEIEKALVERGCKVYHIPYKHKLDLPSAIWRLTKIIDREKIAVIHAHLLDASLAAMIAGKIIGTRKRIFTRHYSNYHHVYHRKGILYDRLCNFLATDIVAITGIVKNHLLMEGANPGKITLIHHGFKLTDYSECPEDRRKAFKIKYDIAPDQIVIGVVSRYAIWKGVQFIIPAFERLIKKYPDAILLLANAMGEDEALIKSMLAKLPKRNVREIVYEQDMAAFYHSLTLFIHTPIDRESEAFGQAYIEAMAAGIPSIITLSGIANDFVVNGEHASVVPYQDDLAIEVAMQKMISDLGYRSALMENAKEAVFKHFSLPSMMSQLETLYLQN